MTVETLHSNMRAAWRTALIAVPDLPPSRHWEGKEYTPVVGTPFVAETFLPVYSAPSSIGRGGTTHHAFTGTATLKYPAGRGTAAIEAMAGKIQAAFPQGTVLTYGGQSGTVMRCERRPLLQEADWIACAVLVDISAWTPN
jgi:hypothetical protein